MKKIHHQYKQQTKNGELPFRHWRLTAPKLSVHQKTGTVVLLGLGSSLGERELYLRKALLWLAYDANIDLIATSSVWQTMPIGAAKNAFYNMCATLLTTYSPQDLMRRLLNLEQRCDRLRGIHWMDRTLDLDILLFGQKIVNTPIVKVPHSRMLERSFVMKPASEIAGDWVHPTLQIKLRDCQKISDVGMWKVGGFSIAHKF